MAHRLPNFRKDVKLGKIGEDFCYEMLKQSQKAVSIIDVSEDKRFQLIDVDFIQILRTKPNGEEYTKDDVFNNLIGGDADKTFYLLYEVKTDTVSITSRNVVYEIISHDGPGCAALSRAHYFFYIFVDGNNDIREAWLIDMKKWRQYIRENSKNVVKMIETKNGGIALNEFNKYNDKVLNILTNIEVMQKEEIAQKINIEQYA